MSNFSSQSVVNMFAALKTQAEKSGLFQQVVGHEPRSAPGNGFTYCLWLGPITPVPALSGLNTGDGRVIVNARILTKFISKSEDQIETDMMHRVLEMIGFYSAGFTLSSLVMAVDLLGMHGVPLESTQVGYLDMDGIIHRVADLTIPVLIDNLWPQAA